MENKFKNLGLSEDVMNAINDLGFEEPSQIQQEVIPVLMSGKDAIGQAQTGTGKTLAFGAPMLSRLQSPKGHVSGLVLAPTRELAVQVSDELSRIGARTNLRILPVFGGAAIDRQIRALREGVDIVVGTPGRVIDLIDRRILKIDKIDFMVLDEADEMLNMGFVDDVETILASSNDSKQTMLFSATMPKQIKALANKYLNEEAVHIVVEKKSITVDLVDQYYFEIKSKDRFETLCRILDSNSHSSVIIFCNTKRNVDELTDHLKKRGYDAEALHGDIVQAQRMRTLKKFKEGEIEFLVATDVAARGIDIENISHVINYDLPQDIEAYVHRIGRTGRAGRTGIAYTLVTPREYMDLKNIEKITKSKIKRKEIPTLDDIFETKHRDIMVAVEKELEKDDYKKFIPQIIALDEKFNLAEVAAALMNLRYKEQISYDYTQNVLECEMSTARIFLTVGKMDKLTPKKLLEFLDETAGVTKKDVGAIDMLEKFTFFEVNKDVAEGLISKATGRKLCGRKVVLEISEKKKSKDGGRNRKRSRKGR